MLRSTLRPWRCLQNYGKARRPRSRVLVPSTQPAAPGPRPSPWGTGFPARPAWLKLTPVSLRRNHTLRTTCPCGLRRTLLRGQGQRCEFSPHFPVCLSVCLSSPPLPLADHGGRAPVHPVPRRRPLQGGGDVSMLRGHSALLRSAQGHCHTKRPQLMTEWPKDNLKDAKTSVWEN